MSETVGIYIRVKTIPPPPTKMMMQSIVPQLDENNTAASQPSSDITTETTQLSHKTSEIKHSVPGN